MINRTKERIKQTGEVFTPPTLVDEILDKLPPELFTDHTKTFIDPAAGDGNFLVRVIAYKIFHGSTPEEALTTTYGVEKEDDNAAQCRSRILTHAWLASKNRNSVGELELLPGDLDAEDEREAGIMRGHDPFARKYNYIVKHNIVCADSLNDWPFGDDFNPLTLK